MADSSVTADRRAALRNAIVSRPDVEIALLPPASRIVLRGPAEAVAPLSRMLDLTLPTRPACAAEKNGRAALWLGPDEWLVIDEHGGDLLAAAARYDGFHAAVDVSHRNVAFAVGGRDAVAVLSSGCPQDLSHASFPVGACTRTVLGKIEAVIWRRGESDYRLECWRSFADYAFTLLSQAARDLG